MKKFYIEESYIYYKTKNIGESRCCSHEYQLKKDLNFYMSWSNDDIKVRHLFFQLLRNNINEEIL